MEKQPMWIGLDLPTGTGYIRVCIGLNLEDGHEVSYYNEADMESYETQEGVTSPWCYDGEVVVGYGEDAVVFDENHKLIKK